MDSCFIRWYLDVRLGDSGTSLALTDGPRDGGIDAIRYPTTVEDKKKLVIVQSYFADIRARKQVPNPKLKQFFDLPTIFSNSNLFTRWLAASVREDLRARYRDLFNRIHRKSFEPEWMFLTTAKSNSSTVRLLNRTRARKHQAIVIDRADVIRAFALFLEGAAPPDDPLEFRYEGQSLIYHNDQPQTAVFAARIDDIVQYVKRDPMLRLFSRNVRLVLPRSDINDEIKWTFRREPENFMLGHNGITLICSQSTISGGRVTLEQPNVVNGAQTLLSLRDQPSSRGRALVLTRVIDVGDYAQNASLVRAIAMRSNTQNAIAAPDLVACDQRQVEIERFFRKNGRAYIRRRGQEVLEMGPRHGTRVRSIALAQILACCDSRVGIYAAGHSKNALFEPHYYDYLFEDPSLNEILAKYCLFEMLDDARKSSPKSRRRKLRYVSRNALAATWQIIDGDIQLRNEVVQKQALLNHTASISSVSTLRKQLRAMYEYGWLLYTAARKRKQDLAPDKFFFGEPRHAQEIAKKLEKKFDRRIRISLRRYVDVQDR